MSNHLNFCFPEWQGYAESNSVYYGALAIKDVLQTANEFQLVEVPEHEKLELANNILGYSANLRQLKATCELLWQEKPQSTFMIGGTCASEIAPVSYLNQFYDGDLAVVWFDAHGDLNTPESSPSKHFHGMPLRTLLGESDEEVLKNSFSKLNPHQVVLAGTRDLDPSEKDFVDKNDVSLVVPENIDQVTTVIKEKGYNNAYIHIDLDVLDHNEFPHLLLSVAGGISIESLINGIRSIQVETKLVGSSIVEYVPVGRGDLKTIRRLVATLGS